MFLAACISRRRPAAALFPPTLRFGRAGSSVRLFGKVKRLMRFVCGNLMPAFDLSPCASTSEQPASFQETDNASYPFPYRSCSHPPRQRIGCDGRAPPLRSRPERLPRHLPRAGRRRAAHDGLHRAERRQHVQRTGRPDRPKSKADRMVPGSSGPAPPRPLHFLREPTRPRHARGLFASRSALPPLPLRAARSSYWKVGRNQVLTSAPTLCGAVTSDYRIRPYGQHVRSS